MKHQCKFYLQITPEIRVLGGIRQGNTQRKCKVLTEATENDRIIFNEKNKNNGIFVPNLISDYCPFSREENFENCHAFVSTDN